MEASWQYSTEPKQCGSPEIASKFNERGLKVGGKRNEISAEIPERCNNKVLFCLEKKGHALQFPRISGNIYGKLKTLTNRCVAALQRLIR